MAAVNASKNRGVEHPVAVNVEKDDTFTVTFGKLAPVKVVQVPLSSPVAPHRLKDSAILSVARAKREAVKKADEEIKQAEESVEQAHAEAIRLSKEAKPAKAATKAQQAGEEAIAAKVVASEKAAEAMATLTEAIARAAKARAARAAMATPIDTTKPAKTKTARELENEVRRLLVDSADSADSASSAAGEAAEKGRATSATSATSAKATTQYKNKESVRTTNAERLSSKEIDRLLQGIQSSNSETKKRSISQLLNIEIVKQQAAEEAVQALSDAEEAATPATIKKVTKDAQEAARKARKDAQEKEAVKVQARNNVKITENAYHNVGAPDDPQWSQNKETAAQKQYNIALTNSIAANNAADTAAREAVKKEAVAKAREKDELSRLRSAEARVVLKREAVVVTKRIAEEATKAANTARTAAGNNSEMKYIVAKAARAALETAERAARSKSGLLTGTTSASASFKPEQPGTKVTPKPILTSELAASTQANEAAIAAGKLLELQEKAKAAEAAAAKAPKEEKAEAEAKAAAAQQAVAQATPRVEQQLEEARGQGGRTADLLGRLFLSLALGSTVKGGGKRTRTHKRNHKRKRTHKR